MRHPKLVYKKLGRERLWGQCDDKLIEIDPRQKGRRLLNTMIHERLHVLFPRMTETDVKIAGRTLADFLWKHGYRKVEP